MRWKLKVPPSKRNGQVEDREHRRAAVIGEQVSYDGGRDGGVAGLADAHQSSWEHKQPVILQTEKEKQTKLLSDARNVVISSLIDDFRCEVLKFIPHCNRKQLREGPCWNAGGLARTEIDWLLT